MKRAVIVPALVTAFVTLSPVGIALADNPHASGTTGQPSKEESDNTALKPPGHSTDAFLNVASQHYAGAPLNPNNGNTAKAVSQYDVAGFQWCRHHATDPTSCT